MGLDDRVIRTDRNSGVKKSTGERFPFGGFTKRGHRLKYHHGPRKAPVPRINTTDGTLVVNIKYVYSNGCDLNASKRDPRVNLLLVQVLYHQSSKRPS